MSRVGKNPVTIPAGTAVEFEPKTRVLKVKGTLGELQIEVHQLINVTVEDGKVIVTIEDLRNRLARSLWGTTRAIIQNMVNGVSVGYTKEMELNGVGYKMELGSQLVLYIGFSHPVHVDIPPQISLNLEKNVLKGKSIDKQLLGNFFSSVHNMKPCDVYKHKGFKFPDRFYRKKVGKKGK